MSQKHKNGERTKFQLQVPAFVTTSIETGRTRLGAIEEQAQELFNDLRSRGNKEIESIREKIPVTNLREKIPVEDLVEKARTVESETRDRAESLADDAQRRLQGLQDSVLALAGIATRDQVASLARDLDRLSRRLDRVAKKAKEGAAPAKKTEKAARSTRSQATSAGKRKSTGKRTRKTE